MLLRSMGLVRWRSIPGEDGPARLLLHGVRGQGDDRSAADPAAALRLPDAPCRLVAVHHGHLAPRSEEQVLVTSVNISTKNIDD